MNYITNIDDFTKARLVQNGRTLYEDIASFLTNQALNYVSLKIFKAPFIGYSEDDKAIILDFLTQITTNTPTNENKNINKLKPLTKQKYIEILRRLRNNEIVYQSFIDNLIVNSSKDAIKIDYKINETITFENNENKIIIEDNIPLVVGSNLVFFTTTEEFSRESERKIKTLKYAICKYLYEQKIEVSVDVKVFNIKGELALYNEYLSSEFNILNEIKIKAINYMQRAKNAFK